MPHPRRFTLLLSVLVLLGGVRFGRSAERSATTLNQYAGSWSFHLPDGNPVWLKIETTDDSDGQASGAMLWSVGSARPIGTVRFESGSIFFDTKVRWKPGGGDTTKKIVGTFQGKLVGDDAMELSVQQTLSADDDAETESLSLLGKRMPPKPPRPDLSKVVFGEPQSLFNGQNLEGWKLSRDNKLNGWRAEKGGLINETPKTDFSAYGAYGNLVTERKFNDFRLTLQYNAPLKGNSGVYLRGMYEAQVVDRDSSMQGIAGPGAVFGRILPSENAGKAGGQWNTYVLTLVDRHITVELNGVRVIDNQFVEGCTGGGISSDDTKPGPIFLQGDHTSVKYRNITIEPVVGRSE